MGLESRSSLPWRLRGVSPPLGFDAQKHVKPDMSAAPSISTPFLPPSLNTLATSFSLNPAAIAASFFGKSCCCCYYFVVVVVVEETEEEYVW